MVPSQMILITCHILTSLITMLALNWGRVSVQVLHVPGYCVSVDELEAHCALGFIWI